MIDKLLPVLVRNTDLGVGLHELAQGDLLGAAPLEHE